jgi:hypothetical protein
MAMSSTDPFEQANEADVAEQAQDLDGSSAAITEPEYSHAEADEADVLEQGADFPGAEEDDEAYPHAGQGEAE